MADHEHDQATPSPEEQPVSEEQPASEEQPERGEQTVSVQDIGPARKNLTIEIPPERIEKMLEENFSKLKDEAVVPGFRRGRVPPRLLRKRFSSAVRDDVRSQLISQSYTQAIEDEKLEVIGQPDVKDADKIELPETGPMKFQVEVEVSPQFELPTLEGIPITRKTVAITGADVDREIDQWRQQAGRLVKAEENAVLQDGDYGLCDVRILAGKDAPVDAVEIAHHPGTYVVVRAKDQDFRGHVAGIVVEDLGKRMQGKRAGDELTISMVGPSGHEDERIKDQPITLRVRVDSVERVQAAELNSLVEQMGVADVDALRQRVEQMLQNRQEQRQRQAMHEQVVKHLLDQVKIDLPQKMTGRQVIRLLHRRAMELAYQGLSEEEIERRVAEMRVASEQDAQRQLKLFFILNQIAKKYEVEVSEAEVNGRIAMMAMQQRRRPEKLRQQMQRSGELEDLYLHARELKTLDLLVDKARISEAAEEPKASDA